MHPATPTFSSLKPQSHTQQPYGVCQNLSSVPPLFFSYCAAPGQTSSLPSSWRCTTNPAPGNVGPEGIWWLNLFRQYLQSTLLSLQRVNTDQLSPESDTSSLTDLTSSKERQTKAVENKGMNKSFQTDTRPSNSLILFYIVRKKSNTNRNMFIAPSHMDGQFLKRAAPQTLEKMLSADVTATSSEHPLIRESRRETRPRHHTTLQTFINKEDRAQRLTKSLTKSSQSQPSYGATWCTLHAMVRRLITTNNN